MNNKYFEEKPIVWNDREAELNEILNQVDIYTIVAIGWYFPTNIIKICHSYEEALSFLEFKTQEEYENYIAKSYTHNEGFWYYKIEKVDLVELTQKVIENKVQSTITEKINEIIKSSELRIQKEVKYRTNNFKNNLKENFSKWIDGKDEA